MTSSEGFLAKIQQDMMPKWELVDVAEQESIRAILSHWQNNVSAQFNRDASKNNSTKHFDDRIDELSRSYDSDFTIPNLKINSLAFDLYEACSCVDLTSKTTGTSRLTKSHTRLLLKAFRQFHLALECFEDLQAGCDRKQVNVQLFNCRLADDETNGSLEYLELECSSNIAHHWSANV
jgi:hypothetical protein